jgi:uncharacterized protein (TIGR02145 family)
VITIGTQPTAPTAALTEGSIAADVKLTVAATVTEGATLAYQWYTNTTASTEGGTAIDGATAASYTLPADLAAGAYYYFAEASAEGAASVRSNAVTVTVNAPATQITPAPIAGFTNPVTGAAPQTTIPATDRYTGSIKWMDAEGDFAGAAFAAEMVYRAIITLTAKDGYTFAGLAGLPEGSVQHGFKVNGIIPYAWELSSDTEIDIFVVFPATGGDPKTDKGVVINGVTWATRNMDKPKTFTATPYEVGLVYQFGAGATGWSAANPVKAYNADGEILPTPAWVGSSSGYSVAGVWPSLNDHSPEGWRIPTKEDFEKLLDAEKVTGEYVAATETTPAGYRFTDKADTRNSIFLPGGTGDRHPDTGNIYSTSTTGYYWTASTGYSGYKTSFRFQDTGVAEFWDRTIERYAFALRCVKVAE